LKQRALARWSAHRAGRTVYTSPAALLHTLFECVNLKIKNTIFKFGDYIAMFIPIFGTMLFAHLAYKEKVDQPPEEHVSDARWLSAAWDYLWNLYSFHFKSISLLKPQSERQRPAQSAGETVYTQFTATPTRPKMARHLKRRLLFKWNCYMNYPPQRGMTYLD